MSLNTGRPVSLGAEALLGVRQPVLDDQCYVQLCDYMGTDESLARIARVSTGSDREDLGILAYLVRNRHTSPIEFGKVTIRARLPIFIARQWVRHRTGSFSERSMRYQGVGDGTWAYVPSSEFVQGKPVAVKQGRGELVSGPDNDGIRALIAEGNDNALLRYEALTAEPEPADTDFEAGTARAALDALLSEDFAGVAPELARGVLPLNTMTEWYWTTDAHNLMHWLRLRLDNHAQMEFRAFAGPVYEIFKAWLPALAEAFRKYVWCARTFDEDELKVVSHLLLHGAGNCDAGMIATNEGMSGGRRKDFLEKLTHVRQLCLGS